MQWEASQPLKNSVLNTSRIPPPTWLWSQVGFSVSSRNYRKIIAGRTGSACPRAGTCLERTTANGGNGKCSRAFVLAHNHVETAACSRMRCVLINPWRGEPPWTDWPETLFEHSVQLPVSPEGLVTDCLFIHAEGRDPRSSVPSPGTAAH